MTKKASEYKVTVTFHDDEEECQRRFKQAVERILFKDDLEIKPKQNLNH